MKEEILAMLVGLRPEFDFNESDDFVMDGFLDSFDIIELISMIEDKFDVVIDSMDILPENFSNLGEIQKIIVKSGFKGE